MTDAIIDSGLQLDGFAPDVAYHVAHPLTNEGQITLTETYKTAAGTEDQISAMVAALEALTIDEGISRPVMAALYRKCPHLAKPGMGLEHFTDVPSRVNFRSSMESVFGAIKDTIVAFVKKVIEYIKQAWQFLKGKVLEWTGFKSTADMLTRREYVATAIQDDLARVTKSVGVASNVELANYFSQIPKDANNAVQLAYVGERVGSLKSLVDQAEEMTPVLQSISKEIPKLTAQVTRSRSEVKRVMNDLRRSVSRNPMLSKSELNDYATRIELASNFTENTGRLGAELNRLLVLLGSDKGNELTSMSEQFNELGSIARAVKTEFKDMLKSDENLVALNTRLTTFMKGSVTNMASIDVSVLNELLKNDNLSTDDAKLAQSLNSPAFANVYVRYVSSVQNITAFVMALNNLVKAVRTNISTLGLWHQRVSAIITANMVSNLDQYQTFISNHPAVADGSIAITRGDDGKPDWELTKYNESLDDFKWDTVTGMGVQALLNADVGKIKTRTNNLLRSLSLRTI